MAARRLRKLFTLSFLSRSTLIQQTASAIARDITTFYFMKVGMIQKIGLRMPTPKEKGTSRQKSSSRAACGTSSDSSTFISVHPTEPSGDP